jgi:hydroxymethylpyrimidine/phosphomethylpyrimidine kinase
MTQPVVLTIAGSDSCGGAGIQADLRAFHGLGVFGATALTAVTVQTPCEVRTIHALTADLVSQQIQAACDAYPVAAVKTGMLGTEAIVRAVLSAREQLFPDIPFVIDPVLSASAGPALCEASGLDAYRALADSATLITPNLAEAQILGAAASFSCATLLTGGHREDRPGEDILYRGGERSIFPPLTWPVEAIHGSGCLLSAAIAAHLAQGQALELAISHAREWLATVVRDS